MPDEAFRLRGDSTTSLRRRLMFRGAYAAGVSRRGVGGDGWRGQGPDWGLRYAPTPATQAYTTSLRWWLVFRGAYTSGLGR